MRLSSRTMQVHFIAIGGSAMHDLAIALHKEGHTVTGSDDAFFNPSKSRLEAHDLLPEKSGWHPERLHSGIDVVILGMHAKKENPELNKARELEIPVMSFPEFVAERSRDKERVVIAGSHGKTTITSMILHVLRKAGMDCDRLVGAQLEGFEGAVQLSEANERILIEGDEYLSSTIDPRPKFLWYEPQIALISGIAWDHANVFPSFEDYLDAFRTFIRSIPAGGTLIYCKEDPALTELVQEEGGSIHCIPYGTHSSVMREEGNVLLTGEGEVPLQIFGGHNMQNLEGAMKVCEAMGIGKESFYRAIGDFKGASLRLDEIHRKGECVAYRDYAHSPSKVRSTVSAVKTRHQDLPLVAFLELHTYSSLKDSFIDEYRDSLDRADEAHVFFNPEEVERKGLEPLHPERIREAFGRPSLRVHRSMEEAVRALLDRWEGKEAVLLFMSSGAFQGMELQKLSKRILG